MTPHEKLTKLRQLADAMYEAAQYLTTDASRLHKAMQDYRNFVISELKDTQSTDAEDSGTSESFGSWLASHCPYIAAHMKPLTDEEKEKLIEQYGEQAIRDCCEDIENRKDLRKRYTSLYRTVLNWLKRNPPKPAEPQKPTPDAQSHIRQPNQEEQAALKQLKRRLAEKHPANPDRFGEFKTLMSGLTIHHIDTKLNKLCLCVVVNGKQERITEYMIDYYDSWQDFLSAVGQCFRLENIIFEF